jgi:hypothetical protein
MRGADLENDQVLLEHLHAQLARVSRRAAEFADGEGWGLSADIADLHDIVQIILERRRHGK